MRKSSRNKQKRQGFTTVPLFYYPNDSINNGKEIYVIYLLVYMLSVVVFFGDVKIRHILETAMRFLDKFLKLCC